MEEYQKENDKDKEVNDLKLNYNYQTNSYIQNNLKMKSNDLLIQKEEYPNHFLQIKPNDISNSNLKINKYSSTNTNPNISNNNIKNHLNEISEQKDNSNTFSKKLPSYSNIISQKLNLNLNENNKIISNNFKEEIKTNKAEYNNTETLANDNQNLYKNRNNSLNYYKHKNSPNSIKINMIKNDFERVMKQKEEENKKYLVDESPENLNKKNIHKEQMEELEKREFIKDYPNISKNQLKDNNIFYNTFYKFDEYSVRTNEIQESPNQIFELQNENKIFQKTANNFLEETKSNVNHKKKYNIKSKSTTKIPTHNNISQINSYFNEKMVVSSKKKNGKKDPKKNIYNKNIKDLEIIRDKLFLANNKLEDERKEIISKYKLVKAKYELLSKENMMIKTKYDINKSNIKILQKKLDEKNHDIEQMKKILVSNNQQINFLNTIKDSSSKMTKDNEELIQQLKDTIYNLNQIIVESNDKINYLKQQNQNDKAQKIKEENESLKIYLNDREKTIINLKNSISLFTQNLDNVINNNNIIKDINIERNEENEKMINNCELKINVLKEKSEKMQKTIDELLDESKKKEKENYELKTKVNEIMDKYKKMKNEYEIANKTYEEQMVVIEKYKNKIKENNSEISEKDKDNENLKKEIEDKNNEIIEIKNQIEEDKKNIEKKNKEIEEKNKDLLRMKEEINIKNNEIDKKNNEIEELNNKINEMKNEIINKSNEIKEKNNEINEHKKEIDYKNKEINDKQNQLNDKNKELEEKKKEIDLQVIAKANLDFFEKVKQLEMDIKLKDKQIEELKNENKNKISINFNKNNIKSLKENDDLNLNQKIIYTDSNDYQKKHFSNNYKMYKIDIKNNDKNINTDYNNDNYFTEKVLFTEKNNKSDDNKEVNNKENNNNINLYENKSSIKTNFDYNSYRNKNEFENEELNIKKSIKKKDYNKESKKNESFNNKNKSNLENIQYSNITFKEKSNEDEENYESKKKQRKQNLANEYHFNYYKSENILNRIQETNINKEINNDALKQNENFENDINNKILNSALFNDNDDDLNKYADYNSNRKNNKIEIDDEMDVNYNKYLNKNKNSQIFNDYNDLKNNKIFLTSSQMSVSQNDYISTIKYTESALQQFNFIYSLMGNELVSFNLKEKKFELISINDNTNGIFNSYLSYYEKNKLKPLLLNCQKGFYILMHKYIFNFIQQNNNISILVKLISYHTNGNFFNVNDDLYSISGNNNTQCEKYSLNSGKIMSLPNANCPRVNSGICNINNEYIYLFYGQNCEYSVERLFIGKEIYNPNDKWEIISMNEIIGFNDKLFLHKIITFLDDFNNIIIFGGEDYFNRKSNKSIFGFNLNNNNLSIIGKIDSCALYSSQYIKLDESIFSVYDMNNGLHFFNKELDYHEIFNLNV